MKDNCGLKCDESTFRYHINQNYNFIFLKNQENLSILDEIFDET
ncbi:MAG: hypothetical protein SOY33_00875 [Candidatus Onthovivens sp.]